VGTFNFSEKYLSKKDSSTMLPELTEWGSPTIFTQIGGACVPSVITFGVGIIMITLILGRVELT
jgi:hypothetical protein